MRGALEVADVSRRHGDAYREAHAGHLSIGQRRVMTAIETCRSAALGGHVEQCEDCGQVRISYNSCLMGGSSNGELAAAVSAFFCALPLFISP
jgi:Transposase zinc-binding domain